MGLGDLLVLGGFGVATYASFRVNVTLGFFVLAAVLLFVGYVLLILASAKPQLPRLRQVPEQPYGLVETKTKRRRRAS